MPDSTPVNPQVRRSRTIREKIIQLLSAAFAGNPDVGVPHDQILAGFCDGRVRHTPEQIVTELINLMDDGLIEQLPSPGGGPLPDKEYKITKDGRDFRIAGCPWAKVDDFSGGQRLA